MGMIYLAHDPLIDRKVAIKLIRADLLSTEERSDYLARFQHEAQAAGRCTHANIVAIYDFALHEGNPFLAMEYVEGSDLRQVLARSGRFAPVPAAAVIGQVLEALACAHGLGIVHRDVKPANILLLADQRVKMTDFGISRLDTSALTQTGSVIGTPSYMSPEQCRGEPADARSDLFSAAIVLFEMLSNTRPFTGRNATEIALQVINRASPDIRLIVPGLPASLVAVIERGLAKSPADRFATAGEMAASLRQSVQAASSSAGDATVVVPRPQVTFPETTLSTLERKLAEHLGPIAHHLVRSAARQAGTLEELREIVASRIVQPEQRSRFRDDVAGDTSARPPQAVAPALAQQGEQELAVYLGPIARILAKRALEAAKSPEDFWQRLAAHIEREADRQAFLSKRRT
jgi:eukaryotic-like serine/threonine-protein kinase